MLCCLNWAMTSLWLQGAGDVYTWGSVVAMSALGLILLWRVAYRGYHQLWYPPKRKTKAKNEGFEHLEISEAEDEDISSDDEQWIRKSNP